jgi:YD repeat-containing protein
MMRNWRPFRSSNRLSRTARSWNTRRSRRSLHLQHLEPRQMLAGDLASPLAHVAGNPWHNDTLAADVDDDGVVHLHDLFDVLADLRENGPRSLDGEPLAGGGYVDVNNDQQATVDDLLSVYRVLADNMQASYVAEGTNTPPDAVDDFFSGSHDIALLGETLLNDSDADLDTLTTNLVSGPSYAASFQLYSDGWFTYEPQANWVGGDSFTYEADDGTDTTQATVTITITNEPPDAVDDVYLLVDGDTSDFTGSTVLINDSDGNADDITAVLDSPPTNAESFTFYSDGTFDYVAPAGFVGIASFTYYAFDGITNSVEPATATIEVANFVAEPGDDPNVDPPCSCECVCAPAFSFNDSKGGAFWDPSSMFGLPKGSLPTYSSLSVEKKPILPVYLPFSANIPDSLTAQLTFNGSQHTQKDLSSAATSSFIDKLGVTALQADGTSLSAGTYNWSITLAGEWWTDSLTDDVTVSGVYYLFDFTDSEFGSGFWAPQLDRLAFASAGASLVRGDLSVGYYEEDMMLGYLTPTGSRATLTENWDFTYTLAHPDGAEDLFSEDGLLLERIDANGNTTEYSYTDADGDSEVDELAEIEDPDGRTYTYTYSSGLLTGINDYFGRAFSFSHDVYGRLDEITGPDPDGGGSLPAGCQP